MPGYCSSHDLYTPARGWPHYQWTVRKALIRFLLIPPNEANKGYLVIAGWGWEFRLCAWLSLTRYGGVALVHLGEGRSLGFPLGLCGHEWAWDHSFFLWCLAELE